MTGTDIIGRDQECEQLATLLSSHRVVTLVGPGGIGKTRLATEVSELVEGRFGGGVYLGELHGASDTDDVASIVARQFGLDSLEAMPLRSSGNAALVVLDNCESALTQAASVAGRLTDENTELVVLATSRAPLNVPGERVVSLEPLAVPDDDLAPALVSEAAAARLFLDRAEAAGATWPLSDDNLLAVGALVRQLDGLPLAIELAAARSRVLAPPNLVEMLDHQLDLLARPAGGPHRYDSLRSAIRASYDPLAEETKRFFRALSVMPAPFDLSLAHAVAGETPLEIDSLDRLSSLIDSSLVSVTQGPEGATRYRLLDSIRAFGHEMLVDCDDPDGIDDRYVDACVAFADEIVTEALQAFTPGVLGRIRDRFVHLAAAITRSLETDDSPARAYRMFLPFYGPTGARTEVAELARRIRERWDVSAPLEAEAWAVMGMSTFLAGHSEEAVGLSREALAHPEATALAKMISHRVIGFAAAQEHDTESARQNLQAAVELARGFSESFARELLISWAAVSVDPADAADSLRVLDESAAEAARNDEAVNVLWAAVGSAFQHVLIGDLDAARRTVDAAIVVADRSGFPWAVGAAHRSMAGVVAMQEGWSSAAPHFRKSLEVTVSVGDVEGVAVTLRAAAGAALHVGDVALAHDIWATVPPRRGLSVIQSLVRSEEERLIAELGPPTPIDMASSLARVRVLLGPGPDEAEPVRSLPPAAPTGQVVRFGNCELDLAMQEIRRDGERVHVEPQVFDVLALLVARRGTVVTKLELFDEVWGDRFVSESALSSRVMAARKAVGDTGRAQRIIRTVHGKGFTFIAEVDDA